MGGGSYFVFKELERIRQEEGEEAYKRARHSAAGSYMGMAGGAITGGMIGSIIPGPGTVIGAAIGALIGAASGGKDQTAGDNAKRAGGLAARIFGASKS
jgi:uncharacterized membrane protein